MNYGLIRPLFGGRMTQVQVDGCEAILAAVKSLPLSHQAYLLATAFHETDQTMQPIFEYGAKKYFDKYNAGTSIGARLGNTQPGDGYLFRGRGYVQITGRANYAKAGAKLGLDLIADPDAALRQSVAARIMVLGSTEGWFTGKKLSDYLPGDFRGARRVINGLDKADMIAGYARVFQGAL